MDAPFEEYSIQRGVRVWLHFKGMRGFGTVQWIGRVDIVADERVFVGVELDDPVGDNDGTVQSKHGNVSKRYFTARPNHGLFILPKYCMPLPSTLSGPSLRRRINELVYNMLIPRRYGKMKGSHKMIYSPDIYRQICDYYRSKRMKVDVVHNPGAGQARTVISGEPLPESKIVPTTEPFDARRGKAPAMPKTIDLEYVLRVVSFVRHGGRIPAGDVLTILNRARSTWRRCPNIVHICFPRITVVGDLHGQLKDLLHIFTMNGFPSKNNPFLFNGDFVDRGACSVEVVVILFLFRILFPTRVFLNRGNHEAVDVNKQYGLFRELAEKYRGDPSIPAEVLKSPSMRSRRVGGSNRQVTAPELLFKSINRVFAELPLSHIINNKVFVVHGGIPVGSRDAAEGRRPLPSLDELQQLNRHFTDTSVDCKHGGPDTLAVEMLWNDPVSQVELNKRRRKGAMFNENRGVGFMWGPSVTNRFLEGNKMQYVLRSHELTGYKTLHSSKVFIVFSASNYTGSYRNEGWYALLSAAGNASQRNKSNKKSSKREEPDEDEHMTLGPPVFVNFRVNKMPRCEAHLMHVAQILQEEVLILMWELIRDSRVDILARCREADTNKVGMLQPSVLHNVIRQSVGLLLPLKDLQMGLGMTRFAVPSNKTGGGYFVLYEAFLDQYVDKQESKMRGQDMKPARNDWKALRGGGYFCEYPSCVVGPAPSKSESKSKDPSPMEV